MTVSTNQYQNAESIQQTTRVRLTGLWAQKAGSLTFLCGTLWAGLKVVAVNKANDKSSPNAPDAELYWVPSATKDDHDENEWPLCAIENNRVTGMWKHTAKDGSTYHVGSINPDARIFIFRNRSRQEGTNQPEFELVLMPSRPKAAPDITPKESEVTEGPLEDEWGDCKSTSGPQQLPNHWLDNN